MITAPGSNADRVVVLVGLRREIVTEAADALQATLPVGSPRSPARPSVRVHAADSVGSLVRRLDSGPVDIVIAGAGLPLETRLALVEAVFTHSNTTTIHLKDTDSGPQGLLPFARGVLAALTTPPG